MPAFASWSGQLPGLSSNPAIRCRGIGWSLSLDPDQYGIGIPPAGTRQFNFIGYANPEVDNLLEQAMELDLDKRMKIYHDFARILLADSPIVYLYSAYGLPAIHKR